MAVLPPGTTLTSFGVLLFFVLLATALAAFNLQNIFSILLRTKNIVTNLIYSCMRRSKSPKWKHFRPNRPSLHSNVNYKNEQTAGNALPILAFIFDSLASLALQEVAYGFDLFKPVRAETLPYGEVRFSFCKLISDLVRLLFLPIWVGLVFPYWIWLSGRMLYRAIRQRILRR